MTPDQRDLIKQLVRVPGRPFVTKEEFLRRYPVTDGRLLGRDLLLEAIRDRDASAFALALFVADTFATVDATWTPRLNDLLFEDWHQSDEWLVDYLDVFRDPSSVPALLHAARKRPDHVGDDDVPALAVKAIYALRNNPSPRAVDALRELTMDSNPTAAWNAEQRLDERVIRDEDVSASPEPAP